jgi:hypothetical protein
MLATKSRNDAFLCIHDCEPKSNEFLSFLPEKPCEPSCISPGKTKEVSKSFEVTAKAIQESYFETSFDEDDIEFISDFANSQKNGIILILSELMDEYEINYITTHMGHKIKYIIYYNGDASHLRLKPARGLTFIRTFSLKSAVIAAYNHASKGMAIVLPKIDQNFDLFEHIDMLN